MLFSEKLNEYISKIGCTAKELAEASELSPAVISRYRSGERTPLQNSEQLIHLVNGITTLDNSISADVVMSEFLKTLDNDEFDYENMIDNLNSLFSTLEINSTALARYMNYDASYLSRIRSKKRKPSNPNEFVENVSKYIVKNYNTSAYLQSVSELTGIHIEAFSSNSEYLKEIKNWVCNGKSHGEDYAANFIKKLDEFDLNEFIRSIHFDSLRVPSIPFQFGTSKTYYELSGIKQAELDFFKATVLSKSTEPVCMCSDMPMEDMAEDKDFAKKWMFAIAMTVKKGLHINMIHNLDRPFNEIMLGLESWIPIYMTGQISPYYLKGHHDDVYHHIDYSSGVAAMCGECIGEHHSEGKIYLTKNKEEVAYYRRKSELLLKKASPLMEVYKQESERVFNLFLETDVSTNGTRHGIYSAPPIYTMPEDLLIRVLNRNKLPQNEIDKIFAYLLRKRSFFMQVLENNPVVDDIPKLSKQEFDEYPICLPLSEIFYDKDINYTYSEYLEHLENTTKIAKENKNYTYNATEVPAFRNIQIMVHENKWVMVSKSKSPTIHFVIRHPKLCSAINSMVTPIIEK